jgi:hypothetical protein
LASIGTTVPTVNVSATALRFFFKVTLKRRDLADAVVSVREPRRLPVVLSPEEVSRLLASTTNIKHKAALSLTYATGLRSSEVVSLKLTDIDRDRMVIRVEQTTAEGPFQPTLVFLLYQKGRDPASFRLKTARSTISKRRLSSAGRAKRPRSGGSSGPMMAHSVDVRSPRAKPAAPHRAVMRTARGRQGLEAGGDIDAIAVDFPPVLVSPEVGARFGLDSRFARCHAKAGIAGDDEQPADAGYGRPTGGMARQAPLSQLACRPSRVRYRGRRELIGSAQLQPADRARSRRDGPAIRRCRPCPIGVSG